jgi:hypothetical protein
MKRICLTFTAATFAAGLAMPVFADTVRVDGEAMFPNKTIVATR